MKTQKKSYTAAPLSWENFLNFSRDLRRDINRAKTRRNKCKMIRFRLLLVCGCNWGVRISDLLHLTWEDVVDKEHIEIWESKTIGTRKKNRARNIWVNDVLRDFIKQSMEELKIKNRKAYLYPNYRNEPISIQYFNREIKKYMSDYFPELPVQRYKSHSMRKTYGKAFYEKNNKSLDALLTINEDFNHSSIRYTKIYLGISEEHIRNTQLQMGQVV